MNALKHGLRSATPLIPGDDVAAFRRLRQRQFELYQPRTIEEALCVETIAATHWRIARCRREERLFKEHLGCAMGADPDVTGAVCTPDPHPLHHRGSDCTRDEARLGRELLQVQRQLQAFQKQRTQNLLPGHPAVEDYRVFLAEGEPLEPGEADAAPALAAALEPPASAAVAGMGASGSGDGAIGERRERKITAAPAAFPKHWSRRQRAAAARRGRGEATAAGPAGGSAGPRSGLES